MTQRALRHPGRLHCMSRHRRRRRGWWCVPTPSITSLADLLQKQARKPKTAELRDLGRRQHRHLLMERWRSPAGLPCLQSGAPALQDTLAGAGLPSSSFRPRPWLTCQSGKLRVLASSGTRPRAGTRTCRPSPSWATGDSHRQLLGGISPRARRPEVVHQLQAAVLATWPAADLQQLPGRRHDADAHGQRQYR